MKLRILSSCILAVLLIITAFVFFTCALSRPVSDNGIQTSDDSGDSRGSSRSGRQRESSVRETMLVGTDDGLYSVNSAGRVNHTWTGGSVKKILHPLSDTDPWLIMGSEGVLVSGDLEKWETRNEGLSIKTIKVFEGGTKSFLQIVQELKDLEVNPANTQIMVTATKDRAYLSRNGGQSWTALPAVPYRANGIKAAACADMPNSQGGTDLTVFLSHSISGIWYIHPDKPNAQWAELINGLEKLETTSLPDEVADIAITMENGVPKLYASQTFRRRIYELDWDKKVFYKIWSDDSVFGTVDSLSVMGNNLHFVSEGTIAALNLSNRSMNRQTDTLDTVRRLQTRLKPNAVVLRDNKLTLHELWLLDVPEAGTPIHQTHITADKDGLYLPVNHAMDRGTLSRYFNTIERAGLNMVVIDMKDDYGRLRFTPNNPQITAKGRVFNPLNLDAFLRDMKERGIFTVARIVVFKDKELASKENGRFAVWDSRNSRPWVGYEDRRRRAADVTDAERNNSRNQIFPTDDPEFVIVRTVYDENWVDPYSEEVWEYIALISEELHERGFDEIQYDYIRFPTDGANLGNTQYRFQDRGMDMESAILSFLRHVRKRVNAPISIDIYGANSWYRTGARTGQEVELFAPWVDVICPMYYPSHFEQYFLAQHPPELRPWRIYYHGTLRTARITRGQVVVRPWTQAFFLNVSYDRQYYNPDYVRRQIEGVKQAGNGGYTHWNNIGRYDDIPDKAN